MFKFIRIGFRLIAAFGRYFGHLISTGKSDAAVLQDFGSWLSVEMEGSDGPSA